MNRFIFILFVLLISFSCIHVEEDQVINDLLESKLVTAEPILQVEENAEDLFGFLGELTVDSEGQIYVTDTQSRSVRIYAQDGNLVQTVGREGRGPGEFLSVSNLTVDPQKQTIWVYDVSQLRVSSFTPLADATWGHKAQFSIETNNGYPIQVHVTNDRFVIYSMRTVRDEDPQQLEITLQSVSIEERVLNEEILTYSESEVVVQETGGEFVPIHPIPFGWQTHGIIEQSGRIYISKSDSLRVRVFDLDGQKINEIKNQIRYQPITAQDIDEYGVNADDPTYSLIPDHHPAFIDLQIDNMGRPWFNLGEFEEDVNTWVVLDNSGSLVIAVKLPSTLSVHQIRGQNIYGIHQNEIGQQSIMVYSVPTPD